MIADESRGRDCDERTRLIVPELFVDLGFCARCEERGLGFARLEESREKYYRADRDKREIFQSVLRGQLQSLEHGTNLLHGSSISLRDVCSAI